MKKIIAAFLILATVACAAGCHAPVTPGRRYVPETLYPHSDTEYPNRDTDVYDTETVPRGPIIP